MVSRSPSRLWNHDVFLSFREDTRKNFVDHLYTALVQKGIHTFKDDITLPSGESVGPALSNSIQKSRIAVIVFSKAYADSSWCLDELLCIMKCKDQIGQIVMPIFYHVEPSDVRKQKGEFGKAFSIQESENVNKAESWRKALEDAANISGWEPKNVANGHESQCIKEIVDAISNRLFSFFSNVNKDLVGIETRLQDLTPQLNIGLGGVRMVGIWGVGGGGKTTLASSLFKEISCHFEGHCIVENIREESKKNGLKKLQEIILSALLRTQVVIPTAEEGRCMIQSRLCHRSVLLVLDDVDDLDQLEALAGSHDWFGEGSRIIITTRDQHLLNRKVDLIYDVNLLSLDEGIQLFHRHAYREHEPIQDYEMLSLDVVSYAGGLPLALKILGSFLYDKDKNEWMSALAKLESIPNPTIMDKLLISYHGLQQDEKELFLDIACFLRKTKEVDSMIILNACCLHPVIGVKVLTQRALITVSNGIFDMHELVYEMALHIVRGGHPNNPEKHSRVWQDEDVLKLCETDQTLENDMIEMFATELHDPRLPHVIASMRKLRGIYWCGNRASSFPKSFPQKEIRCIILEDGLQKQLWKGHKYLPNLKSIYLNDSRNLIKTPDFSELPSLERLELTFCLKLKEIHPSIGYHKKLVHLFITRSPKLKMFPPIIQMEKLQTLELRYCCRKFPDIRMNMGSLVRLCLCSYEMEIIPSSVGQRCTNLVSLDLTDCEHLKRIVGNFHGLRYLRELHLKGCPQLEPLGEDFFGVDCCLEVLSLPPKMPDLSFKEVLNLFGFTFSLQDPVMSIKFPHFPRFLRRLNLSWCNLGDEDVPFDIGELLNLQVLDLSGNIFTRLHPSLLKLHHLKFLNVSKCKSLIQLPDLPSSIAILNAYGCTSLIFIADVLTKYKWLWKVSLSRKSVIDTPKVLQSMLQGNAVEGHFLSLGLKGSSATYSALKRQTFTMQLPRNWYNNFGGFLVCAARLDFISPCHIVIKQETCIDSEPHHCEKFNKFLETHTYRRTAYLSFGSLRRTSWWNPAYSKITFYITDIEFIVKLVPRLYKVDSMDREKDESDCSEFWDEEVQGNKTFEIQHDSKSFIEISWHHLSK